MKITFDIVKQQKTLLERGIDFNDAPKVFDRLHYTKPDNRFDYGEKRFITFGFLDDRFTAVVWTKRRECHHIISMRKANEREKKEYKVNLD